MEFDVQWSWKPEINGGTGNCMYTKRAELFQWEVWDIAINRTENYAGLK